MQQHCRRIGGSRSRVFAKMFTSSAVIVYCAAFGFIAGSPTLRGYLRDVLATPGLAGTVRLDHIKAHYFTSHPALNPYGIIPLGPVPAAEGGAVWWEEVDEGERAARAALTGAGG